MKNEGEPLVVAIDIGGTKVGGAYVSGGSEPVVSGRTSFHTAQTGGGMGLVDAVVGLVDKLITDAPGPVRGLGVGSAGVIDPETGVVTSATDLIPDWAGSPFGPALRAAFGLPMALTGDVLAHAIGEDRFGAGRDYGSALAVAVGTGIGGAFVTRSGTRSGTRGLAGHVGHVRHPYARDLVCSCGRTGHVEAIASGTGISEEYERITGRYLDGRGVDDILVMADCGSMEDARMAAAAGSDILSTTMAGYSGERAKTDGPDVELLKEMVAEFPGIPVLCEGRVHTPAQAAEVIAAGAWAVVVGTAITHPTSITTWFKTAVDQAG